MHARKHIFPLLITALALICHSSAQSDETLRQKIGQMFIIGFNGTTIPDSIGVDLGQRNLGE